MTSREKEMLNQCCQVFSQSETAVEDGSATDDGCPANDSYASMFSAVLTMKSRPDLCILHVP